MTRKVLLAAAACLATGALLGCLDAIAPHSPRGRAVSLAIVPEFDGFGADAGIPGDVDLIRITLHNPPAPDTTLNFPIAPGQDSITISIPIVLPTTLDTVGVTFQAIRSSDSTVLYSGTQDYPVQVGPPLAPSPLVATYVGPGRNILSITAQPHSWTAQPGDTVRFGFLALDSASATIVGMPALFATRNAAVATVDAAGLARAVGVGTTYLVVTSGARTSVKDSALITVATSAPPVIGLSATAVTFRDTAGTSDPTAQTVAVSNAGGGTLGGLTVGTISYGAGGAGWLTPTLSGTTAPATLTLAAAKGSLAAGTYTATVPVQSASAANTPQTVAVTFTIAPAIPTIALSPTSVSFLDTALTSDPAAKTVNVTNGGLGTLSGLTIGTISYSAGGTGWLTPTLSGATAPATLTLAVAKGSLAAGTYTAIVPVQAAGASNTPQNDTVTFTIVAAPTIGLSATSTTFTDTLLTSDPPAQTINVTSAGGTLSDLVRGTIGYGAGGTGWLTATLSAATTPATLTLSVAKGSLAAGTYTATVPVQSASAGNSPQTVSVTFTIAPPPLVTLAVSPGYRVAQPGDTVMLAVTGKDASNNPAPLLGLTYASRTPAVATVSAGGVVTAVASGTAVIVAQAPTATGTTADSMLVVVPAAGSAVVAAIGDARAYDVAAAGNLVTMLVLVDLRAVPGDSLGSYNAQLNWNPTVLTYDSSAAVDPGFAGATTVNPTQTASGQLRFGSANPNGTGGSFALFRVTFTAAAAGSSPLTLALTDLSTAKTFQQLLGAATVLSGSVTVH